MAGVDPDEPREHVICQRCKTRLFCVLPMDITVFAAMLKAFSKAHAHCREGTT